MPTEFGRRGATTRAAVEARPEPRSFEPGLGRTSSLPPIGKLLFSFDGRIPRLHYWLGTIGVIVAYQLLGGLARVLKAGIPDPATGTVAAGALAIDLVLMILLLVLMVLVFWISLAIHVRRWHDRDRAWVWMFLGFIPIVGWIWQGVECGFLEGTLGPNRFGPSPKGIAGLSYEEDYARPLV